MAGLVGVAVLVAVFVSQCVAAFQEEDPPRGLAGVPTLVASQAPDRNRSVEAHAGYGTWVDTYDYLPGNGSGTLPLTPAAIDEMARTGVGTLYLQAARSEPGSTDLLTDPARLGELLVRAQRAGMQVVGWYLPRFADVEQDLAHLEAIADFEVLGHRFDGIAVDIEWTADVPDHRQRSDRLVELSERLRDAVGDDPLGAIVLPPVQIEVVNPRKWPGFPWAELASLYDVWLPMSYWTERRADSGYLDGHTYTFENIERLRANLDDPAARIHAIGGIGDRMTETHAAGFLRALDETDAMGASIYDWTTLSPSINSLLARSVRSRVPHSE